MRPTRLVAGGLLALLLASPALAQAPLVFVDPEPNPGFLSRAGWLATVDALSEHDTQYYWDANLMADVDAVDFGRGRVNALFNYEMVMGNELQPFDPRLGNYTFDVLGAWRWGRVEGGVLFRHVSRHLSDRAKDFGIAWNDLGIQVLHVREEGLWHWQVRGQALATVARGFVDYRAMAAGDVLMRRRLSPLTSLVAATSGTVRFVRPATWQRGTQYGGRVEVGVRIEGRAAAIELVGGAERRIDADPLELAPRQWVFAGMKVLSR